MTNTSLAETRVGKIVAKNPRVARVFEQHQIDYCCRGGTTLSAACQLQDVDVGQVVDEIEQLQNSDEPVDETNWNEASLTKLADHIVDTHHQFLRREMPRVSELTRKVNKAHGEKCPDLARVVETFRLMRAELENHMAKEENILFPAIRVLDLDRGPQSFPFGSVANPIGMMEHEHDDAGNALRRLRELTDDYTPPSDACPTWRVMLESLEHLERDLHLHIHKENNILFPRATQLEQTVTAGS